MRRCCLPEGVNTLDLPTSLLHRPYDSPIKMVNNNSFIIMYEFFLEFLTFHDCIEHDFVHDIEFATINQLQTFGSNMKPSLLIIMIKLLSTRTKN